MSSMVSRIAIARSTAALLALPLLAVLAVAVALVVLHRAPGKVDSPATTATVSTVAAVVTERGQPTGAAAVTSHVDEARADEV